MKFIVVALFFSALTKANAQIDSVLVGKLFPVFQLNDIQGFDKKQMSVSDFRGKYLILDVYNKGCVSCVASWPKTWKVQQQFKDKLQILLLGVQNSKINGRRDLTDVKAMYAFYKERMKHDLPSAFDTTTLNRFKINAGPLYIWIDKDGIVKAITAGTGELTEGNIQTFISNKPLTLKSIDLYGIERKRFDVSKELLINGNESNEMSFAGHSFLNVYDYKTETGIVSFKEAADAKSPNFGKFQCVGCPIRKLYQLAYLDPNNRPNTSESDRGPREQHSLYGKVWTVPVFDIKDSSLYFSNTTDLWGKPFNYSLVLPKRLATVKHLRKSFQNDLESYLGLTASFEMRLMPFYRVVIIDSNKLQYAQDDGRFGVTMVNGNAGFSVRNASISQVIMKIKSMPGSFDATPMLDYTGLKRLVNMTMKCNWLDLEEIRRELNRNGLDLVKDEKPMKVLVVKDAAMSLESDIITRPANKDL